jgi:hypothetical protein
MHSLVRRYIKTSIVFLLVGLGIGGWMIIQRELLNRYPPQYEISAHTHAVFVGFVLMMIQGVALWLFPRPEKGDTRYSPALASAAWWLVTVGTGVRVAGELARIWPVEHWVAWAIVAGGMAQLAGVALFFHTLWPRIRAVGSQAREARGERF